MDDDRKIIGPTTDDALESAGLELQNRIDDIAERMKQTDNIRKLFENERKVAVTFDADAKMQYLMALAACGRMGDSAGFSGVTLRTVQLHRNDDSDFRELEQVAIEAYRDRVRAAIDEEGIEGALQPVILRDSDGGQFIEGWRRVRNPRILELAAKLNLPEFRERIEVSGDVGLRVGVLAVGAAPADPNAWSDKHKDTRLLSERLDLDTPSGTVEESNKVDRS